MQKGNSATESTSTSFALTHVRVVLEDVEVCAECLAVHDEEQSDGVLDLPQLTGELQPQVGPLRHLTSHTQRMAPSPYWTGQTVTTALNNAPSTQD